MKIKDLHIVMPMAGEGSRFKQQGYQIAKPLISVSDTTIYEKALSSLRGFKSDEYNVKYTFIVREEFKKDNIESRIKSSFPNANIIYVEKTTRGALETSFLAAPYINDNEGVILMDCDMYFNSDTYVNEIKKQLSSEVINPCLLTFHNDNARYSYVALNENGYASKVVEKQVISNNAILGCYFVGDGKSFKETAKYVIDEFTKGNLSTKEIYTSLLFDEYIKNGKNVNVVKLGENDTYLSMGTPEEFEETKKILEN